MKSHDQAGRRFQTDFSRGMTLVEILFSLAIGVMVLGAVASTLVMAAKTIHKNQLADDAANTTRKVQEHLSRYLAVAISQSTDPFIRPVLGGTSDGLTPAHYTRIDFRVSAGPIAYLPTLAHQGDDTLVIACGADLVPVKGDYLLCDYPALGTNKWGVQIIDDPADFRPAGTAGNVSVHLASTIAAATLAAGGTTTIDMAANTVVTIQRPQAYEAMDPGTNAVGELHYTPHTYYPDKYVVLSKNVDASARYMFALFPPNSSALEQSISWQFSYATDPTERRNIIGSNSNYYQLNYTSGQIMPKSGNPLNLTSGLQHTNPPSTCTTSTSTSTSISTTTTSSISTTTSSIPTSTTSTSTTSISTSSTTSTSTTSISTSSTTSISTSVTTTTTTIPTTTTSTIPTTTTSTSSISTTTSTTSSTTSISTTTTTTSTSTSTIEFDG